jgi:hypothetical protein
MKSILGVLVVALAICASSPAMAVYFNSTATGSMCTVFPGNGYGDGGGTGQPKLSQANSRSQQWGYTSFYNANDGSGTTLKSFMQANPTAIGKLYVLVSSNINGQYVLETLRSGNTGAMTLDALSNGNGSYTAPGAAGSTEPVAWKLGAGPYSQNGDYKPANGGIAWITPSGRIGSPGSYSPSTAGAPIDYTAAGGARYGGYENQSKGLWALGDLLGTWASNNNGSATLATITSAGQYLNGGMTTPSIISSASIVAADPKGQTVAGFSWLEIPLDATMLNDIAMNSQNKGLVFMNSLTSLTVNSVDTRIYNSAGIKPYLSVVLPPNALSLDVTPASLYVRPGESVVINMDASRLAQMVNGCQALLGYSSTYFTAPHSVAPGGGPWTELIYESWTVPGELDTAIGVTLTGGPAGTQADGTVAIITLTAGTTDGTTQIVFRSDGESGYATMFSDLNANPVWPYKTNSTNIVVDGTAPLLATVPANGSSNTVTAATQTITGTASDALSGIDTLGYTLNGGLPVPVTVTAGAFSVTVVLVPGANQVVFTLTDKAGNPATSTINYTYNQPAPTITIAKSVAPNVYGASSYLEWQANRTTGVLNGTSPVGSGFAKYEAVTADQDYTVNMVSNFNSWLGVLGSPGEYGNRLTYVYRIDNGIQANPGAAKLDLNKVSVEMRNSFVGSDNAADNFTDTWGYDWLTRTSPAEFEAGNARLKGYNWVGGAWVEVTSGRLADLLIFDNGQGYDNGSDPESQATLDGMYKQLSGAAANKQYIPTNTTRQGLAGDEYEVRYTGHAGVGNADVTVSTTYKSTDATKPVITITAPTDGAKVKVPGQTITGTVTDNETLASGVREVKVFLNTVQVGTSYTTTDPVNFSEAVTLVEGSNEIRVDAKDFAGNTETKTIHVFLDTVAPTINIDSAVQNSTELLISKGSTTNALQGNVVITVSSSDASPSTGLVVPPAVKVTDANAVETVLTASGSGPWTYTYAITSTTANGIATILATISDEAGNSASDTDTFRVNKNQITGQVELQDFVGTGTTPLHTRTVTFVSNGGAKTWTLALTNVSGAVFDYTLTDVPVGTTALSAKTAWNLRKKLAVTLDGNGQATVTFTAGSMLPGGDLNNDNFVNILDYSLMKMKWFTIAPEADINGDGLVNLLDYSTMKASWFTRGDAQ